MTTPAAPQPPGGATTSGIPASRRKLPTAASSGADSDSATPPNRRPVASDPLSDRATSILIRRVLCPQQQLGDKNRDAFVPIEQLLPPLTSRNDVDLQLYAFLAIILRDFVQTWYGKITTDETFVAEIVHIVAHCTTALEQRFRQVDLECLLLDEVPDLLDRHITAYRTSHHALPSPPIEVDPREVYHSLCPLPHLSPVPQPADEASIREQQENEALYRQLLVQAVLAVLLPTEDLENPCLTSLVGQIFSELIIGNVIANRAAQPWLLWEGICILARVFEEKKTHATQILVGRGSLTREDGKSSWRWAVHSFFLSIINLVILFITSIRLAASAIMVPSSLPPRVAVTNDIDADWESLDGGDEYHKPPARQSTTVCTKEPILDFSFWSCAAHLIELPTRMPWLSGFASIVQYAAMNGPGHLGRLNGTLDR
jgi:splicing suppressor protein 51